MLIRSQLCPVCSVHPTFRSLHLGELLGLVEERLLLNEVKASENNFCWRLTSSRNLWPTTKSRRMLCSGEFNIFNRSKIDIYILYSPFYRTQVSLVRSMGPVLCHWVSEWVIPRRLWNLTDVTLVDEDTNSIPTNNTNRTIQDNMWQWKWQIRVTNLKTSASGLMANIETNASCLAFSIVLWFC